MFESVNEIGRLSLTVCVDLSRNVWWLSARNIQHMSYVGFPPIEFTTLGVVQAFYNLWHGMEYGGICFWSLPFRRVNRATIGFIKARSDGLIVSA